MALFQHGKGTVMYCDGYDITGILKTSNMPANREELENTSFGPSRAKSWQPGTWDGTVELGGYWVGLPAVPDYASILRNAAIFSMGPSGLAAVGAPARIALVFPTSDEFPNDASALLEQTLTYRAQNGIGRGRWYKIPGNVGTGTNNGATLDLGAARHGDWQFAAHVQTIDGGTLAVALQHSADQITWVTLATLASLSAANTAAYANGTANVTQIERYTRLLWTLTGGTAANFVAAFSIKR